jgi:hypothetical protein
MRDWPNPMFAGTLEQGCSAAAHYPYLERIALEVEDPENGLRYVLAPAYHAGLPPWTGDLIRCSDISFEGIFRVLRVAKGYPGRMICGRYPDDFRAESGRSERRTELAS